MKAQYCKQRRIKPLDFVTPILVPSFSSKGIKDIGQVHTYYKEYLLDASLVSAFDLHYENILNDNLYESEILFVDSGGYERDKEHDMSDIYGNEYIPNVWNRELYYAQIKRIEPITRTVLVNYDYVERFSLFEQIDKANENFASFPHFASDFLCKPISESSLNLDINDYCESIQKVFSFSILGFTEKELGSSVLERCTNIFKIREALYQEGLDTPIHIFGCLDPLNIMVYFLSGADIFDGLSWLRYSFYNGVPTYFNSFSIEGGLWNCKDTEVKALSIMENLKHLNKLKSRMIEFTKTNDWYALGLEEKHLLEIQKIIKTIQGGRY